MIYHKDWILPSIESCQNVVQAYIDDPVHGLLDYEGQYIVGHESDSETYFTFTDLDNYSHDPNYIYMGFLNHAYPPQSMYSFQIEDFNANVYNVTTYNAGQQPKITPIIFNKIDGPISSGSNELSFIGYKFKLYAK